MADPMIGVIDSNHSQAPRKDVLPESDSNTYTYGKSSAKTVPDYTGPNRCSTSDPGAEYKSRDEK